MRCSRKRIPLWALIGITDEQEVSQLDSGSTVAVATVASLGVGFAAGGVGFVAGGVFPADGFSGASRGVLCFCRPISERVLNR